jgi:dTDP-4-dehydrorhamnose reductase
MTVWVTGSTGMLGQCVGKLLSDAGQDWVGSDIDVDISDSDSVRSFAARHGAKSIINCAAYTAVDAAETDEANALRVNGAGPSNLAEIALEKGIRLLHVSTDYVFDGSETGEYTEDSPVGPHNAYGRTKLAGEVGIQSVFEGNAKTSTMGSWNIIRTSWLFGSGRSSFVDTMWKLMLEKEELRVVKDQKGRPTYALDLAACLVGLVKTPAMARLPSGIFHFANRGDTTWYDLACEIKTQLVRRGLPVKTSQIHAVSSSEFPRPAKRPQNSVLSTKRIESFGVIPRGWQQALADYVDLRIVNSNDNVTTNNQ